MRIIDDPQVWDKFVADSTHSTIFHRWDFLRTVEKHVGFKLLPYGIYRDDKLICLLPLFYKTLYSVRMLFSPPPRSGIPYLGYALGNSFFESTQHKREETLKNIYDDFSVEATRLAPDYTLVSFTPDIQDLRQLIWAGYKVDVGYTYILDLSQGLDEIWRGFNQSRRYRIKKAQAMKIDVKATDRGDLVFDMIAERYNQQGLRLPLISGSYLNDLKKLFPNNIRFMLVESNGEVVGSEAVINHNGTHMEWLGGVRNEGNIPVNEYLTWESIKKCKSSGVSKIDFLGANKEGIATFKSQFGGSLATYFTAKKKSIRGILAEAGYFRFVKKALF